MGQGVKGHGSRALGSCLGGLGGSLGGSGALLEGSWMLVGGLWALLGGSWGLLGELWGAPWGLLGARWYEKEPTKKRKRTGENEKEKQTSLEPPQNGEAWREGGQIDGKVGLGQTQNARTPTLSRRHHKAPNKTGQCPSPILICGGGRFLSALLSLALTLFEPKLALGGGGDCNNNNHTTRANAKRQGTRAPLRI